MESPVAVVKSAINPMTIVKGVVGFLIIAAIFDALGFTDVLLRPFSYFKARFAAAK